MSGSLTLNNCPSNGYTSPNGLHFALRCNSDRPNLDDLRNLQADNVQDCLNHCAENPNSLCGGAEFNFDTKTCWLKTDNVTTANRVVGVDYGHFGVANKTQLQPLPSACSNDGQTRKTDNGLEFLIHCGEDMGGSDLCPDSSPGCRYHADSLQECMELCSKTHPLCTGVAFNWDMAFGFANCYPKIGSSDSLDSARSSSANTHSAIAQFSSINGTDTCNDSSNGTATASNQEVFDLSCNILRSGDNITVQHTNELEDCVNACAEYRNNQRSCVAVQYDTYMTNGYQNCYLKSSQGFATPDQSGFTFAALRSTNSDSSSSSKAWIAGPVAGGIVAIALVALALWWRQRRKKRQEIPPATTTTTTTTSNIDPPVYYKKVAYDTPSASPLVEPASPRQELEGHQAAYEMQGDYISNLPPQELPASPIGRPKR